MADLYNFKASNRYAMLFCRCTSFEVQPYLNNGTSVPQ